MLVFSELINKVSSKGGSHLEPVVYLSESCTVQMFVDLIKMLQIRPFKKLFVMYLYDPVYISQEIWLFSRREI